MMLNQNKLGLGTVQFGQSYGVSNQRGQVPKGEVAAILDRALKAGVRLLDTAANYGDAEAVLAGFDLSPFRVVTKTINLSNGLDTVVARARQSAERLKADTLLVHAAADLADNRLWPALQRLKAEGVFTRIGISVYAAEKPAELAERFKPDVMQLPFSVLDQRLLADGTLARLAELGVEVHARSLFLQGLLLMETLPQKLRSAQPELDRVRAQIAEARSTPLATALGFVLSHSQIGIGLVGVTSLVELEEILTVAACPLPTLNWSSLALKDERLLTPSLW